MKNDMTRDEPPKDDGMIPFLTGLVAGAISQAREPGGILKPGALYPNAACDAVIVRFAESGHVYRIAVEFVGTRSDAQTRALAGYWGEERQEL